LTVDPHESVVTGRYQLIDFGHGRKLESLAGWLIDRPCPAAVGSEPRSPRRWADAAARFETRTKTWRYTDPWPPLIEIDCGRFRMPVAPTPFGHIGLFPEQFDNWQWLATNPTSEAATDTETELGAPQALNLFAYTGASTMALVAGGFQVAHVDAAQPNVQAARAAARHNFQQSAAIRYLVEDAAKFARRERRRGRNYHTIVLDPPAYGHSPQGKAWRIERDLWPLLDDCLQLMVPDDFRLLVTGHSAVIGQAAVIEYLRDTEFFRRAESESAVRVISGRSALVDQHRRRLDAGFFVRVSSRSTSYPSISR
jgi:23S rRNA (cytosine1962-C5)-methyltransferase